MASRILARHIKQRTASVFGLQITSLIDMFTMLLCFMLKSMSTSAFEVSHADGIQLPSSSTNAKPIEIVKVVLSPKALYVGDKKIIELDGGMVRVTDVDAKDPFFVKALFEELDREAEKTRSIASVNETVKFDVRVLLQIDRTLSYGTIRKIIYTSMLAGYADVKLAVVSTE